MPSAPTTSVRPRLKRARRTTAATSRAAPSPPLRYWLQIAGWRTSTSSPSRSPTMTSGCGNSETTSGGRFQARKTTDIKNPSFNFSERRSQAGSSRLPWLPLRAAATA